MRTRAKYLITLEICELNLLCLRQKQFRGGEEIGRQDQTASAVGKARAHCTHRSAATILSLLRD